MDANSDKGADSTLTAIGTKRQKVAKTDKKRQKKIEKTLRLITIKTANIFTYRR